MTVPQFQGPRSNIAAKIHLGNCLWITFSSMMGLGWNCCCCLCSAWAESEFLIFCIPFLSSPLDCEPQEGKDHVILFSIVSFQLV